MQNEPPPEILVPLILLAFAVGFPLIWCGVIGLLSKLGGYGTIAARYPGPSKPPEGLHEGKCATLRGTVSYKHTLSVATPPEGLYVWTMILFRFRHPPILVPWDELVVGPTTPGFLFGTRTEVTFPNLPGSRILFWDAAGDIVAAGKKQFEENQSSPKAASSA